MDLEKGEERVDGLFKLGREEKDGVGVKEDFLFLGLGCRVEVGLV